MDGAPMPEASVHKYREAVTKEDHIRAPGRCSARIAKSEPPDLAIPRERERATFPIFGNVHGISVSYLPHPSAESVSHNIAA